MVKAMVALINNGKVISPHLLQDEESGKSVTPYQAPKTSTQIASAASPYWGLVRQAMFGMANEPNGTGYKFFHTAPYGIAAKSGTSQVFSLKENQTYNAKMIPIRLRDHVFYTAFAPYKNPKVAVALILENGGSDGVTAAPIMRQIMDHLFAPQESNTPSDATATPGPIIAASSGLAIKNTYASIR